MAIFSLTTSSSILCFFIIGFVCGITVEERVSELERVIIVQSETLTQHESLIREQRDKLETVQNENDILKTRVEFLEGAIDQLREFSGADAEAGGSGNLETEDGQLHAKNGDVRERQESSIQQRGERHIVLQENRQRRLALPLVSRKIAFYARSLVGSCLRNNNVLVFYAEELDVGNGYNTHSGIYVVHVTGTYVFTWTIYASDTWYTADIVVNGHSKGKASVDSFGDVQWVGGTGVIVTNVTAGDQVFIRRSAGHDCRIDYTEGQQMSFAGWLLF